VSPGVLAMRADVNNKQPSLSGLHSSIVGECLCHSHLRALKGVKDKSQPVVSCDHIPATNQSFRLKVRHMFAFI
jgi:hypothetical protein